MVRVEKTDRKLTLENVRIAFRNFSGEAGKYNRKGDRNFCVILDECPELVKDLEKEGWNIKWLTPRDEDEPEIPYLPVKLEFSKYPPIIYLISSGKKTKIGEEEVGSLDWAEIENADGERNRVDLQISPYTWEVNGKIGVKAYVKALYVTLSEDRFAQKYMNVPDSTMSAKFPENEIEDD